MRHVIPNKYLHGYEAAYKVEQQKQRTGEAKTGVLVGLKMLFNYPYVLGIFGMVFFYDLISVVLSYISVGIAQSTSADISEVSEKFFEIVFKAHLLGFFISFFVTGFLLRILGIRWSLLLVPATAALVITHYMLNYSAMNAIVIAIVALRAIHYSFSNPVRESLYIPTVKEINFKARSWGDSFGSKVAKTAASMFNLMAADIGSAFFFTTCSVFFASSVGLWLITAYFVGRRFDRAVAQNEVIGAE
jgi:AAA family ATP:ADP antiporter